MVNLTLLDFLVIFGGITFFLICAHQTKKHTKSVADFLAAIRCAGRYLIGISQGMANLGLSRL